jgi:hypothetical protein
MLPTYLKVVAASRGLVPETLVARAPITAAAIPSRAAVVNLLRRSPSAATKTT